MQKDSAEKYNAFTTKNGNVVWVGTMSLAWQQFTRFSGVKELKFATNSSKALKTIDNFNNSRFSEKQINSKSIYVKAGKGPNTQSIINKEVKQKFPHYSFGELKYQMSPNDIIAFAYLFKQIKFQAKFKRRQEKAFLFNNKKVDSFYANSKQQRDQIEVGHYKDKNNFSIRIADKDTTDVIYMLKGAQYTTVDQVINEVNKLEGKAGSKLAKNDLFEMPVIQMDVKRSYEELIGLRFSNNELKDYLLAVMMEAVKLKVDQSGAKVQSMAVMMALKSMVKLQPPKQFILNQTFWLVMKEKKKHPYLCVQVVDPIQK